MVFAYVTPQKMDARPPPNSHKRYLWIFCPPFFVSETGVHKRQLFFLKKKRKNIHVQRLMSWWGWPLYSLSFVFSQLISDSSFQNFSVIFVLPQKFLKSKRINLIWHYDITKTVLMVKPFSGLHLWEGRKKHNNSSHTSKISRRANHWNSTLMSIPSLFCLPGNWKRCETQTCARVFLTCIYRT